MIFSKSWQQTKNTGKEGIREGFLQDVNYAQNGLVYGSNTPDPMNLRAYKLTDTTTEEAEHERNVLGSHGWESELKTEHHDTKEHAEDASDEVWKPCEWQML